MNEENLKLRHIYDKEAGKWYFSIVDTVALLIETADARNYWKVLKSRLKTNHNELVTNINQLKLPSSDGKFYASDVADAETLLAIAEIISPNNTLFLRGHLEKFEQKNQKILFEEDTEFELLVDVFHTPEKIFIKTMLAGVYPSNLAIKLRCDQVEILGKRMRENEEHKVEEVFLNELYFGTFSRTIPFPEEINIDESEAEFSHGLLTITLPKLDKKRERILKTKN